MGRPEAEILTLHDCFEAYWDFRDRRILQRGMRPWNEDDSRSFIRCVYQVRRKRKPVAISQQRWTHDIGNHSYILDESLARSFSEKSKGSLSFVSSIIGGIAAQEVLKACSLQFRPLLQVGMIFILS